MAEERWVSEKAVNQLPFSTRQDKGAEGLPCDSPGTSSSGWIKEQHAWYAEFAWQTGYGEFSVTPIHVEAAREYIRSQPEHHKQEDFQTEYRRFCERNGKPLDERYAWD